MKKILLSAAVILGFTGYSLAKKSSSRDQIVSAAPTSTPSLTFPTSAIKRGYKDGSYTGPVADAFYGPLQIQLVVSGGKITDVQFLQYPNDRSTSREINAQAMPMLKSEAIAAQSAKVDGVSGATQTSQAFVESLQAILSQAK